MSDISLNEQADHDKVGNLVLQFVDHYGDMYVDKYGPFAGDDLVFIDAAQYCGISVLDAIYKFQNLMQNDATLPIAFQKATKN